MVKFIIAVVLKSTKKEILDNYRKEILNLVNKINDSAFVNSEDFKY